MAAEYPVQFVSLHAEAPDKPVSGAPCNGCGICCAAEPCPVGRLLSGQRRGPCAALLWEDDATRYLCGVLVEPTRFIHWLPSFTGGAARRLVRRWIAAGAGCDSDARTD